MNLTEVREYESSDEEDMEVDHATTSKAGTKRPAKIWVRDRSFDSAIEAIKYMKGEKEWSLDYKNNTSDGEIALTEAEIDTVVLKRWNTFDQYKKRAFSVWIIDMPLDK
jgi:hypothetical protein